MKCVLHQALLIDLLKHFIIQLKHFISFKIDFCELVHNSLWDKGDCCRLERLPKEKKKVFVASISETFDELNEAGAK